MRRLKISPYTGLQLHAMQYAFFPLYKELARDCVVFLSHRSPCDLLSFHFLKELLRNPLYSSIPNISNHYEAHPYIPPLHLSVWCVRRTTQAGRLLGRGEAGIERAGGRFDRQQRKLIVACGEYAAGRGFVRAFGPKLNCLGRRGPVWLSRGKPRLAGRFPRWFPRWKPGR